MATCTYNIELNPSQDVFNHWFNILRDAAAAYNDCARFIEEHEIHLSIKEVHDSVYAWMRDKYPSLPSQTIIKVYKDVIGAFRSIRKNKHEDAKTPYKKHPSLHFDKRLYGSITRDGITLSNGLVHTREFVPFAFVYQRASEMFDRYTFKAPLLFFRNGRMYLSIPFDVSDKPVSSETACGVDLGLRQLFVTSEGTSFNDKHYLNERRKIRYKRKMLYSKKTKSARRKARKLMRRERNLSKDVIIRAVLALIKSTNAGILVLEELKGMKKKTGKYKNGFNRKDHNRRMSQVAFHQFKEVLSHKAPLAGKRVETVSPTYTSQTDSRTNKRNGVRCGRRYICNDGVVLDADWNAAVNIARRSNHPLSSESTPYDGGLTPLGGRSSSVDRMHCKPTKANANRGLASPLL